MTNKNKNKYTIIAYLLLLSFATIFSLYMPKTQATAQDETVIPNEAIRLRILANSDSEDDQALKRKVRDAVNAEITKWVQDLTSLEEARTTIKTGLPEIQQIAEEIVAQENETQSVKVDFGKVEFPTKLYGQFLYPAGEYEAILITLGEGEGANWWCVLFPPLCFLDFSNGVAVSEGFEEEEINESKKTKSTQEETDDNKKAKSTQKETEETASKEYEPEKLDQPEEIKIEKETVKTVTSQQVKAEVGQEVKAAVKTTEVAQASTNIEKETSTDSEKEEKSKTKPKKSSKKKPVYTSEDEDEVEVKFFVKELWEKIF
jgi:stage II sporulation protein R